MCGASEHSDGAMSLICSSEYRLRPIAGRGRPERGAGGSAGHCGAGARPEVKTGLSGSRAAACQDGGRPLQREMHLRSALQFT